VSASASIDLGSFSAKKRGEHMSIDRTEFNQYSSASLDQDRRGARSQNMSDTERWVSLGVGVGLLALGLKQGIRDGLMLAITGGALLYRGATGQCPLYKVAGIDTSSEYPRPGVSVPHGRGVKVENTVLINKSPEELYSYWRQFENLPKFMENLVSVKTAGGQRSHWVVKAIGNAEISWDAEIVNDVPNELIAWRTVENSDVDHAGSVRFEGDERGTRVKVTMEYRPPAGKVGVGLAKLFGQEPRQMIESDLRRFKQLMESGEVLSVEGQSHGGSVDRSI
jgi:uncharacterized membrane protein